MFTKITLRASAAVSVLAVLLVVPHLVIAQASSWVGQKVVTRYDYPVKIGNQFVEKQNAFHVYTVTKVNGDLLWVVSGRIEGWLPASQAILLDQAIDFYTLEIKANTANSAARVGRAQIWKEKGEYDKAIADYGESIHLDPNNPASYICRGIAWSEKKEYDKAIADFSYAIRLDQKNALAFINRGNAWSGKREFDKAIADYNEAIRLDPPFAVAFGNRGNAWSDKKEYDKAIADCNEAIRLDPNDALAYSNRGNAWNGQERIRQGDRRLQRRHTPLPDIRFSVQQPR